VADWAVLASGNGSNFEALARGLAGSPHRLTCLICDRRQAGVFERARRLGIASHHVSYSGRSRHEAEKEILGLLGHYRIDLVVLAGFMRLLSPDFIAAYPNRIVNIHPALLPRHPGRSAIEAGFFSTDPHLGISIHYVDAGVDTGPVIEQHSFPRIPGESLEKLEARIHALEHASYPPAVLHLLDAIEKNSQARSLE
jgi:phosphoribosylglycinamide formyltransferase 1